MQNKHLKLLKILLDSKDTLTAQAIATSMGVSDRSIKNHIGEINFYEPNLIISSNRGYNLAKDRALEILQSHLDKLPETSEERCAYIFTKLLNLDRSNDKLDIHNLASSLFVSYETIKRDLFIARRILKESNLYIINSNDELSLAGSEKDKRKLFSNLLFTEFSRNLLSLTEIAKIFPSYDINLLVNIISDACKEYDYYLNEYALISLMLDITISIDRIKNNHAYSEFTIFENAYDVNETALANKVIFEIQNSFSIIFNEFESRALKVVLLSSMIRINVDNIHQGDLEQVVGKSCMELVEVLRTEMAKYNFIEKANNNQFLVRFSIHIKNLLIRLRHGHITRNPLTEHIRNSCPLVFDCAVSLSEKIKELTGFTLDEHEIAYIALHIGSIVGNVVDGEIKTSCTLLVPKYHNQVNQLIAQLTKLFGPQLIIIAVKNSPEQLEHPIDSDFIISTIQLPQSTKEWVFITPFLTDRDISLLQFKLERIKKKKKQKRIEANLRMICDEKLFFFNPSFTSQEDLINNLCKALYENNYVDEFYVTDVFDREMSYSTAFGNLAVPHSMKMNAIKTGLCVAISERPFPWGNNMVNVVLLFSINQNEKDVFYDVFDNLIVLLLEPPNLSKVRESKSFDEFITNVIDCF